MRKSFLHNRPKMAFGRICGVEPTCRRADVVELGLQRPLVFADLVDPFADTGFLANQNVYINLHNVFH